jgi:hypothetical protein
MKKHFSGFSNLLLAVGIAVAMVSRADASHLTFSNTAPGSRSMIMLPPHLTRPLYRWAVWAYSMSTLP